jgi:L-ascorbate metabolism protein UlaG (beta-lactamase superfamily)
MNQQLTRFYDRFGAGNGLFYPGHASALVVLNGKKILFDPIVISQPYDDAWVFYPPQIVDPRWYEVDAVVVSHIHQDHYDLKFLSKLGPQVKVMIVGQRPVFEKDIQQKSGREITILQPDTVNEIFPNVYLYAINHESNGIDSSAIVYNDDFCVYHGNDNYLQPESMRRFTQVRPHIDVACIPYAYIHWYPFLMEYDEADLAHKDAERARLVNYYMDDCLNNAEILNADVVIPFGANLLIDDGNMRSEINMAVQTPVEFTDYARSQRPDIGARVQPMLAGDFYGVGPDGPELEIARGFDAEEYRDAAQEFLAARPQKAAMIDGPAVPIPAFLERLSARLAGNEAIDNVVYMDLDYRGERLLIEVDCLDYRARRAEQVNTARAYHHFKLDQVASADWLNGKRFEEVIGMRRFTVKRVPNLYLPNLLRLINTVF